MLKIGVTGGIGSGKSIVCKALEALGYPVFYSDIEAKKLMHQSATAKLGLQNILGEEAYINGELNKAFIATTIFTNPELKNQVNDLIHPLVRSAFTSWASAQNNTLVFNEAAILFETGSYKQFDATLLVTADRETRIKRVMARDHISKEEVETRMKNQWEDEKKIPLADFVIYNDDKKLILPQLITIIETLLKK